MKHYDTIIVGAGLAGVSAAFELTEAGQQVLLLEAEKIVGGRTSSWTEKGMPIESGLHRFLGFYHELPRLLNRAGVDIDKMLCWEDEVEIRVPDGGPSVVVGFSPLHRPFRTLSALFTDEDFLTAEDKLALGKFFADGIARYEKDPLTLDKLSVKDLADEHKLSDKAIQHAVVPFTTGLFFLPIEQYSALVLFAFLVTAAKRAPEIRLGAFEGGMTQVMIEPIIKAMKDKCELQTDARVDSLIIENDAVVGVRIGKEELRANQVVMAASLVGAQDVIKKSLPDHQWFQPMLSLPTMPVVTVHIDTKKPMTAVDRTTFCPRTCIATFSEQSRTTFEGRPGRLSVIMADPDTFYPMKSEEIIERVLQDFERLGYPVRENMIDYRIVRYQHDFYRIKPNVEHLKPTQKTPVNGLVLAGDYTKQTFLGTMEGAVISGQLAAEVVLGQ